MNSEEIKHVFDKYSELEDDISYMIEEWIEIETGKTRFSIDNIQLRKVMDDYFEFEVDIEEHHCGCCPGDYSSYVIPASCLWTDGWAQQKREEKREANLAQVRKHLEDKEKAEKERAEAEYQQYIKLKEKYDE